MKKLVDTWKKKILLVKLQSFDIFGGRLFLGFNGATNLVFCFIVLLFWIFVTFGKSTL